MKKQLLAAAVATVIAAPMAASADVTVYGKLHYSIDSIDYDSGVSGSIIGTGNDSLDPGYDGLDVNSHASRFGIKGSEDLGNGLSAVFQMEFGISGDDLGSVANNRNTYVALAGNFGVAGIGQVDTPFKSSTASLELFGDSTGDYNQLGFDDIRTQDAVFYMSPNWNGFSFVAAVVIPSASVDSDGVEATSLSASYSNGPFFAALAYESVTDQWVNDLLGVGTGHDFDKWRLGLGYTANGLHVGFIYEDRNIDNVGTIPGYAGVSDDSQSWQLSGSYAVGNNTFKVAYGQADDWGMDGTKAPYALNDVDQWTVGLDHKLSSRTKLYVTYSDFNSDTVDSDWDALSLGVVHSF